MKICNAGMHCDECPIYDEFAEPCTKMVEIEDLDVYKKRVHSFIEAIEGLMEVNRNNECITNICGYLLSLAEIKEL